MARQKNAITRGFHQVQAFFISEFAVVQNIHAVPERHLDRRCRAHVCGDSFAMRVRGLDRGPDLFIEHDGYVRARAGNGLVA